MPMGARVTGSSVGDESRYVASLASAETVVTEPTLRGSPPEMTTGIETYDYGTWAESGRESVGSVTR